MHPPKAVRSTRPLGGLHPPEARGEHQASLGGPLHPPKAVRSTRPLWGLHPPEVRPHPIPQGPSNSSRCPSAFSQELVAKTMPGAASAGTGTGSSAGSRRVGPAGGCLSPGRWNLPAPLGVWGRGAEFTPPLGPHGNIDICGSQPGAILSLWDT